MLPTGPPNRGRVAPPGGFWVEGGNKTAEELEDLGLPNLVFPLRLLVPKLPGAAMVCWVGHDEFYKVDSEVESEGVTGGGGRQC